MNASGNQSKSKSLRAIPSVEAILNHPLFIPLTKRMSRPVLRDYVRAAIQDARAEILAGRSFRRTDDLLDYLSEQVNRKSLLAEMPSLRPVINATGVVIHTNLGRAPLAEEAVEAIHRVARGYSNLEYDLDAGRRGRREVHGEKLLSELLGCESAVVVNNNAAAVLLVLNTLADGGEVIVSRGELVEIGGSFRIPDIMAKSGAKLREVGTTNRTRLSDYEQAINEHTRLLLRVHPSNFQVVGFTERPRLEELVALGQKYGLPCYEDLGSGCLTDLSSMGINNEPTVQRSLRVGVDICSFSGDKLLGGPQAGVIVGQQELVSRLRENPLMRVLRPDKLTYATLEATLRLYRTGQAQQRVPVLSMLEPSAEHIRRRVKRFLTRARRVCGDRLRFQLRSGFSVAGGGAAPSSQLETVLIVIDAVTMSAVECEERLRMFNPPIISRIEDNHVVLDLRTVRPEEETALLTALQSLTDQVQAEEIYQNSVVRGQTG